jgi:hypothetical protein
MPVPTAPPYRYYGRAYYYGGHDAGRGRPRHRTGGLSAHHRLVCRCRSDASFRPIPTAGSSNCPTVAAQQQLHAAASALPARQHVHYCSFAAIISCVGTTNHFTIEPLVMDAFAWTWYV